MPRNVSLVGLAQRGVFPQNNSTSECSICDPVVLLADAYVMPTLKDGRGGGPRRRAQHVLVVAQIAISFLILVAAGLFVRTLNNLHSIQLGYARENILLFLLNARQVGHRPPEIATFCANLRKRFESIPGVSSATLSQSSIISAGPCRVADPRDNEHRRCCPSKTHASWSSDRVAGRTPDVAGMDRLASCTAAAGAANVYASRLRIWNVSPSPTGALPINGSPRSYSNVDRPPTSRHRPPPRQSAVSATTLPPGRLSPIAMMALVKHAAIAASRTKPLMAPQRRPLSHRSRYVRSGSRKAALIGRIKIIHLTLDRRSG